MSQPQLFHGVGVQALKKYPKPRKRKKTVFEATKPLTERQKFYNRRRVINRTFTNLPEPMESLQIVATYHNPETNPEFITPPITSYSYLHFDIYVDHGYALDEAVRMGCGIASTTYGQGEYGWVLYELLRETIIKWRPKKK